MHFLPFPELKTERLLLRQVIATDAPEILYLRSNETVNQFIKRPVDRQTRTIDDARDFIEKLGEYVEDNASITWSICLHGEPKTIGTICLWNFSPSKTTAELGYDLGLAHHGKGIMSEALKGVVSFGFEQLKLEKIEAFTDFRNEASIQLLTKNGFVVNSERSDENNPNNRIFERKKLE